MEFQLCRLCGDLCPTVTHASWILWSTVIGMQFLGKWKETPPRIQRPEYAGGTTRSSRAVLSRNCWWRWKVVLIVFLFYLLPFTLIYLYQELCYLHSNPYPQKKKPASKTSTILCWIKSCFQNFTRILWSQVAQRRSEKAFGIAQIAITTGFSM